MLQPIERPLRDVVPNKIKWLTVTAFICLQVFYFLYLVLNTNVLQANNWNTSFKVIAIANLFLIVLSEINVWTAVNPNIMKTRQMTLVIFNLIGYIVLAFLFHNNFYLLLYTGYLVLLMDILNKDNNLLNRALILTAVISVIAIHLNYLENKDVVVLVANLFSGVSTLFILFISIYLFRIINYSNGLIADEKEKRNSTFLQNKIDQLEVKQKAAYYDPMTHLLNRRGFEMEVEPVFERCKQNLKPFGLIMLDIDHFKKINDTYGHDKGDLALKVLAKTIDDAIRPNTDAIARFGGEEFVITTIGVDSNEKLLTFAERIRKIIEKTEWDENKGFTISLGAVLFPYSYVPKVDDLIEQADMALYESKSNGRNRVTIYQG